MPFDFLKRKKIVPDPAPVVPVTKPPPGTVPESVPGADASVGSSPAPSGTPRR